MKVFVVNSAGGSFSLNYVTDILWSNYAGDNVCCNYADFEVLWQSCRCIVTVVLVDLSVAIMQVTAFFVIMQLDSTYTGDSFCSW